MRDDVGVTNYRYIITKDGKEFFDSKEKKTKNKSELKVELNERGKYSIKLYAKNKTGNKSDIKKVAPQIVGL